MSSRDPEQQRSEPRPHAPAGAATRLPGELSSRRENSHLNPVLAPELAPEAGPGLAQVPVPNGAPPPDRKPAPPTGSILYPDGPANLSPPPPPDDDEDPHEPLASLDDPPQPLDDLGVDIDMVSASWQATSGTFGPPRSGPAHEQGLVRPQAVTSQHADRGAEIQTDAVIMLRVRDGDETAFTYLIEKYQRQIVHFMFRMVHNQAVAEELTQEVFLRVYRSRESYRAEAKFTTWLYRIATNLGVNHARDHKHERAAQNIYLDQPDAETGTTPDVADSRATVEHEMLRTERMRAIREHVMALPERQRHAVLMHKYQEMDYKQIGEVLKLSESATKSLLFRAYQTLREKLKEYV